jgi:predicted RNA methylase
MLLVAEVQPGEVVIDVGSGDGRIVMMAAEAFGAKGIGIELDEGLVGISRSLVTARGLDDQVQIIHANALDVDLSPADVITLYLEVEGLKLLRPHLEHTLGELRKQDSGMDRAAGVGRRRGGLALPGALA